MSLKVMFSETALPLQKDVFQSQERVYELNEQACQYQE
jgi:hypothetical protein